MKLFKRTLSLFLAFMMVFTSVSLLASADLGNDGMTWKMYFKYYREADVATKDADGNYVKDADGNIVTEKVWVEATNVKAGDKIKARLYAESNYAVGVSEYFLFYPEEFLEFDPTNHTSDNASGGYKTRWNTAAGSIPVEYEYAGSWFTQGTEAVDAGEIPVIEGCIDESDYEKYDWFYVFNNYGSGAVTYDGADWLCEFDFIVKSDAKNYGGVFVPEGGIQDTMDRSWSLMYLAKQPDGDGGEYALGVIFGFDEDFNYILGGPNFDYESDLVGASADQLAAAKAEFEELAEKEALSLTSTIKYNLNGGTIGGATTLANAEGLTDKDAIALPANPTKVVGSGDSATELKFLGWNKTSGAFVGEDGNTYYDSADGIYYVDAATAAAAGNANQAGLIADLSAQTFGYSDITLTAVYQSPAKYQQNVYVQNIENDEYTLSAGYSAEIDAIGGDVIKSADYAAPEGFTVNAEKSTAQITVSASTVETLNIYLDRNVYTATFKSGENGATVETKTGKYGAALTAPTAAAWVGHNFTAWNPTVPATFTADGTYEAQYASAAATIIINYSYVDKANNNALVTGTVTKESLAGFNYAIVETVPADPAENTTYITYDEILDVENYEFATATPATGVVSSTGANVTVTFKAVDYTATFVGGSPETVNVAYYDKLATLPEAPAAEAGYQFDGWYNGDVKAVAGETVITGDVTFTAKYSKIPRTITYVYEGAPAEYTAPAAVTAYIGDTVTLPELPVVNGYEVGEWVIEGDVNGAVGTADVTVTSTWTRNVYVVTYYSDADGNNVFTTQEYYYGEALVYPEEVPTKKGYTFDFWDGDIEEGAAVEADGDIYAQFTTNSYKLIAIGHDNAELDLNALGCKASYYYGEKIYLADLPTKAEMDDLYAEDYYVFNGWYYNGNLITDTTVIPVTDDVTIVADIVAADAVLTFDANGATFANGDSIVEVELKVWDEITEDMYPEVPEYEGHTFQSWDDYPDMMDEPEKIITINWKKNTYTVKYVNGLTGATIDSVTADYGTDLTAPALPTATGYTFAWDIDLDTVPAYDEDGNKMANGGTVTVTAVPTAEVYKVNYIVNGNVVNEVDVAFGTAIDATVIPSASDIPAGYNFIGWNLADDATAAGALGNMPADDVNVYAVLQAKGDTKYTVEIYEETLDGEYVLKSSTEYNDGTTGKVAPYVVNQNVTGFVYNEDASIVDEIVAGDGSTVLEVYYDRKSITVNFGDETQDVPFGTELDVPEAPAPSDPGQEFDKWVDENGNEVKDTFIVPDSAEDDPVVITPVYKNRMINVYYYVDGKLDKTVATEYTKAIDSTVRPTALPAGYSFLGWNLVDGATEVGALGNMPATEVNVYAVLEAHTNVKYTVEIYKETLNGTYELADTQVFNNGTAGEAAPYDVEEVTGFEYNYMVSVIDTLIAGDGSTVLKVYYDRKTISVVVGDNEPVDVPFGSEIDLPDEGPASPDAGKEFDKWVDENGNEVSDPYVVPDSADGTPVEIIPTYKNRMINVYYYVDGKLDKTVATEYTTAIDATVRPTAVPAGYSFLGWNLAEDATEVGALGNMPATEVNVYAVLEAHTNVKYTVEIYKETLDGDYELADTKEYTNGTPDQVAPYVVEDVTGFIYNEDASIVDELVAGDGSTVLEVYYDRKTVTVKFGDEEAVEYPYGETITVPAGPASDDAGKVFDKWVDENGAEVKGTYTVTENNTVITPVYKNLSFEVTFIDELAGTTKTNTLEYTTLIPNPGTPYVEGYEFDGWYTDGGDKYVAGTTTVPNANATYYAKYTGLEVDYVVNVYFEKADGSGWEDVQSTLESGVAGEYAEYTETFEGFTLDTKNSVTKAVIKGDGTTELVIYFTRNDVKYTADGKEITVPYGTEIKESDLAADVEPGYKLDKWTDAEGNDITFPVEIKGGETFVPVIVKDTFTAKFVLENGTQVGTDVVAEYEAAITAPEAPAAPEGMTFRGWLDKETNTYFDGKMPAKNVTYTAFYANNDEAVYTVNIYIMNTQGVEELSGSYSATATIGTTQSIIPGTVACCTLDTARSNTSCVILADGSASINLYFVRGLYTVSFDGEVTEVYAGAVIPVPADPEKEGQKFLGWSAEIPAVMPEENLSFTSVWEDEIYTITYIVGDEEIVQEYKLGDTVTAYAVTTAPAGLVFDKWSAEIPATMPAKNIVVSAVFKAAAYTVTYLDANGDVFVSYSVAFDAVVPVPTEAPEKEFYTFAGWADVPATMPNHDVTILPVFNPIEVKLVAAPGSSTIIDRENGYIYGLEELLTAKILDDNFLDYEGDGKLVIKPAPTGSNRYGTGAVVELYNNADGSLVETFTIIVFGDLNGDSVVNGLDVSIADDEAFWITEWSVEGSDEYEAYLVFAANLDKNAVIDNIDVSIIKHHTLGVAEIDQTTGKLIRS